MHLTVEQKYQLLLDISQKVRDTLDLEDILGHLLDSVKSVLDYDAAGIFVLNQDLVYTGVDRPKGLIAGVVRRGFDQRPPEADPMLRLGKGIIGYVIDTGECVILLDVRQDSRYVVGRTQTLSEIAVPIVRMNRAFGALNLESDRLAAFDESDIEVLQFFAGAAAISIEKAMLHRQLVEKELLEKQVQLAREVQSRLLPGTSPAIPGYDIAGICIPADRIGGDYFDFIPLSHGRLCITVADVSGHGIPSALVMTAFRALVRTYARSKLEPARITQAINQHLPEYTGGNDYVTAIYAVLDSENGQFAYTSSGHPPPILVRTDGSLEVLEQRGPALGFIKDARYPTGKVVLNAGDVLVLYTDGVLEVTGTQGEEFGAERLTGIIQDGRTLPASQQVQEIIRTTRQFSDLAGYPDDFTLVVIRREMASNIVDGGIYEQES